MAETDHCDVLVVGGGTAAFEAAVSAKYHGAGRVILLEKASEAQYGRQRPLFGYRLPVRSRREGRDPGLCAGRGPGQVA